MIGLLLRHQAWADASLYAHIDANEAARNDEVLINTLHHIAVVQRAFLLCCREESFDLSGARSEKPASLAAVRDRARSTVSELVEYGDTLDVAALEGDVALPWRPGVSYARRDILLQVVMHTQNHRGQCLTRLRELGCAAPALDYILWARDTPAPQWPE